MHVVPAASGRITDTERADALAIHDETDKDFVAAIEGLTEEQWTFRPAINRWSIQETAEHIVLVAGAMGTGVEQALTQPRDPNLTEPEGVFETMKLRVLDRSIRRIQAPAPVTPHNRWPIGETIERFRQVRAAARTLLTQHNVPLKSQIFASLPGTFNCYHWLILISLHTRRHLAQIVEVKTTTGYASGDL